MDHRKAIATDISKYLSLSEEEFDHYHGSLKVRTYKKKAALLPIGAICREAFFILEGCIRYYNELDGEEHTGQFFFEGSWYSDYESFLLERPSDQAIQALEKTTVAVLSKSTLEQLYKDIPKFERFGRFMAENAFMGLRKRTESLAQLSAQERYDQLVKTRPKVIQRVPQHYIASYLGIRPQSLSRIRNSPD